MICSSCNVVAFLSGLALVIFSSINEDSTLSSSYTTRLRVMYTPYCSIPGRHQPIFQMLVDYLSIPA